ncbi:MAG: bifunctional heptose 7-phosphate kinase/heptose 1-phosphate adenyltransferase [Kiritimatiellia bacterium]
MLTSARAAELLDGFRQKRILIAGDLMLDRYVFGTVDRISPEAPVPVLRVTHEEVRPGGASNVALNIRSLGATGMVCGIAGRDAAGAELQHVLAQAGLPVDGIVVSDAVQTTVKTRVIADRQQIVRVDRESTTAAFEAVGAELAARVSGVGVGVDAVLLEDYGKGVVDQGVVDTVLALAASNGLPAGFDPKDNRHLHIPWMTVATPNYREACSAAGQPEESLHGCSAMHVPAGLRETGRVLAEHWQTACLMITLGPRGVYVLPREGTEQILPTQAREVFDVSGAGDTFIATAVLSIAAGASYAEAAQMANHAAGVVVGKVGTATCSAAELLDFVAKSEETRSVCV